MATEVKSRQKVLSRQKVGSTPYVGDVFQSQPEMRGGNLSLTKTPVNRAKAKTEYVKLQ
jgi:hypothetical protein